jgi:hypothetical protein
MQWMILLRGLQWLENVGLSERRFRSEAERSGNDERERVR